MRLFKFFRECDEFETWMKEKVITVPVQHTRNSKESDCPAICISTCLVYLFLSPKACFLLQCFTYLTSRKLSYFKLFSETPNQSAFVIAYYMYRYHILDKIHIRPVLISKYQISFYFYFSTFKFLVTLHHFITLKQSRKHKYYMQQRQLFWSPS